ncbi:hypothetical protein H112_05261 [Trichophyton rubrum D6]|uniref:Protein kinase domain-containing protein n=2 Tax=Trichophyton TaxID=5550 RepID=A0A022VYS1_TRIRU|nr:hypothetical protein H100_05283 [Trichophyton rubrum MR850]EZF40790.1 hypothetical protein H102_05273 [Trichophyton rubrum CBS 100081]EZF51407.1 hypothetical protein H103_05274 [Trichophyton rubrum CBS 288.86]EZF62088.1 hypothetical protein H104_05264 [Trichophyton rubrum CBS 289.86]EZF72681.1 hypothetical protein H105_05292 [Trichophyton soudanense CBS 452.61]EZF83461.1 hypothetical protein H110_05271 [Trichophyton rubrum MR1448]EZG15690.1 hypothetical protein H107_05403 [Trichophyton rub
MATQLIYYVENLSSERRKPFAQAEDETELSNEIRGFLCRIMKLDPRDRPTAIQLAVGGRMV